MSIVLDKGVFLVCDEGKEPITKEIVGKEKWLGTGALTEIAVLGQCV
jgi:hypothetical protein